MTYNPVSGSYISSPYLGGFRSNGGHSGVDLAAPRGTSARAFAGGTVISAGWGGAYGNLVKIRHTDGSIGYYAHLNGFAVKSGERVARGSLIGRIGSTGNATGPHLHAEVRVDGSPVDPTPWLADDANTAMAGPRSFNTSEITERDNTDLLDALEQMQNPPRPALSTPGGGFLMAAEDAPQDPADNPLALETMLGDEARFAQRAEANLEAFMSQPRTTTTSNWSTKALHAPVASTGGNAFNKLLNAIADQESEHNYSAVNPDSGALGKYQVMPGNVASWSRAALGYSVSPQQFLRDSRIQEKVVQHRLGSYYKQYGAGGAALAWYAGEGALSYSSETRNRPQGRYPSMNSYVSDILRKAGL